VRQRIAAVGLLVLVAVATVLISEGSSRGYMVKVILADAGGLQNGSHVTINGVTVGEVTSLGLNKQDRAVAEVSLEKSAAPLGSGATALVQIEGFFGERELDLTRGDLKDPEPSGTVIPVQDSGVSVRFDDVVDALDPDVQGALTTFLDEQGTALVGRGTDLASVLQALPPSLASTSELLDQLSANNQALGSLVYHSDRVVASIAGQRAQLGQLVASAGSAFNVLASRRAQLGETVQRAAGTLRQAQLTLATLQGAAIPLSPAADGLRAAAPSLTTALQEIPRFANAAVPTLNTIAAVAPQLQRLADEGTPVVRNLEPLTSDLTAYSSRALGPLSEMLADKGGAANLFGLMEGWARSTQGYDAAGHVFRFGATVGSDTFGDLLRLAGVGASARQGIKSPAASRPATPSAGENSGAGSTATGKPAAPTAHTPQLPNIGAAVNGAVGAVKSTGANTAAQLTTLLGYLLKP